METIKNSVGGLTRDETEFLELGFSFYVDFPEMLTPAAVRVMKKAIETYRTFTYEEKQMVLSKMMTGYEEGLNYDF